MYTASCLCGGIQLKINTEIPQVFVCHCQQCQKAQGSAFVAIAPIETKNVEIVKGQELCSEYYATTNKKRVFCKSCGSPLFSARLDLPDLIRLRVGIINEPLKAEIASHAFTDDKAAWFEILDDHVKFKEAICE
ncbi:GFA family protein [Acinetobacter wuhouensis]|uniref:GFA family protein n=1 Tax=Acinetobacter wuhouensis TaxID=1879050 RepID=UPI00083B1CC4|nr:GFA family protein [Acinetobacter wuhouensis]AXQ21856.1 GFA family protein [Acinetobacter wuhouensis]